MTAITIRKLPEGLKQKLRLRAAANGQSMEAEARDILAAALLEPARPDLSWLYALLAIGEKYGGIDLELPPREPVDFATHKDMFT